MTDPHKLYTNKHYDDKVEEIMTNDEFEKLAREVINTKPKNNCPDCLTRVRTYLASTQEWQAEINKLRAEVERLSELVRIRSFANNEMVSQLQSERAKSLKYREALESVTTDIKRYSCANHVVNWVLVRNEKARQLLEDMSQESQNDDTSIEHGAGRDE